VGTVWLALAVRGAAADIQVRAERLQLAGDRSAVREQTVRQALRRLREAAA
jgi:nicotinamide-nucleotide amidase